ncbi:hypothetical protein BJV78DRAFT_224410 [Lactifluus subvellereus]|nr:hypothetical protein BJV78DRAFT_224410 [Lactifluus subvellereus]
MMTFSAVCTVNWRRDSQVSGPTLSGGSFGFRSYTILTRSGWKFSLRSFHFASVCRGDACAWDVRCFHSFPGHFKATGFLFLQVLHIVNQDVVTVAVSIGAGAERKVMRPKSKSTNTQPWIKFLPGVRLCEVHLLREQSRACNVDSLELYTSLVEPWLRGAAQFRPRGRSHTPLWQLLSPDISFEAYEHEDSVALLSAPASPCPRIPISGHPC